MNRPATFIAKSERTSEIRPDIFTGADARVPTCKSFELMIASSFSSGHRAASARGEAGRPRVLGETLAQTIVMLAKQGERDPVRLEQRAIEFMSGQPPDLARSHNRCGVCVICQLR